MSTKLKKNNIELRNSNFKSTRPIQSPDKFKRKKSVKIYTSKNVSRPVIPSIPQFQELHCGDHLKIPIGIFKITEELAIGRCCEVYIGEEKSTNIRRAVKVFIRKQNYKGALARELKFLDILSPHKHIVTPKGFFQFEGRDILIHELLSKTLKDIFVIHVSGRRLPSEWLIVIVTRHLISGLSHMNKCGVVHGDLKPQNIMWCGEEECFKLIDFGVSFSTSENMKHAIQSRAYQAPETIEWNKSIQLNSHRAMDTSSSLVRPGPASDIWSAGCIVSELMCGSKVFQLGWDGEDVNVSLKEALCKVGKNYSSDFQSKAINLFQRAMSIKWKERATADELLKDPFFTGSNPMPSIFDLLLLPSKILRLMKVIRPETKSYESEIIEEILETVEAYQPLQHKLDNLNGSVYLRFESIDKSMNALQCLRNTCIRGYTIIPTFFPFERWTTEEFY